MAIKLNERETTLRVNMEEQFQNAHEALKPLGQKSDFSSAIEDMGNHAHNLYMLLKKRDLKPHHHRSTIHRRGMTPDSPDFYKDFHPIEELIAFLDNDHENDYPDDQTINVEFKFPVWSNRWKHEHEYRITRTISGWYVQHIAINGPCDKSGTPYLYMNFGQDYIEYPNGFGEWMEWLWEQAAVDGLSQEKVQDALVSLGEWVGNTEKNRPNNGFWANYS